MLFFSLWRSIWNVDVLLYLPPSRQKKGYLPGTKILESICANIGVAEEGRSSMAGDCSQDWKLVYRGVGLHSKSC